MRAALILAAGRAAEACEPKGKAGRNSHHQGGKANHKGHEGFTKDTKEASPPNFSKTGYTGARTHKGAPMPARSDALETVWQYAAEEAVAAGSDHIEPVHLLVGICSIEELFSAGLSS